VTIGVLRLSNNWVVSRIMTFYVETFRNVPVLLWIVLTMAIFIENLPPPNAFRGDSATASMYLGDAIAFTNRGFYIPAPVFHAGSMVVVVAFLLSIVGIFVFGAWSRKRQEATGDILPNFWIKLGIFIIPSVLIYLVMGRPIGLEMPELKGFNFQGGIYMRNSLLALTLALSLYTAAFIAENVRAGILAVSKGQSEAAFALGLRPSRTMNLVILPQALRVIIPPLISQYLNLTKNSSLAIAVGYMDVTGTLGGITLNQTGKEMECLLILMAIYLTISLTVSTFMNWYNESVKLRER
jgi:general L-amino acid transport system permease protein